MPEIINFNGAELQIGSELGVIVNAYLLSITILFILIGIILQRIE